MLKSKYIAIAFSLVLVLTLLLTFNLKRTEAKIESGEINVQGMTCAGCAYMVKLALEKEEGVLSAEVDPIKGDTVIKFNSLCVIRCTALCTFIRRKVDMPAVWTGYY